MTRRLALAGALLAGLLAAPPSWAQEAAGAPPAPQDDPASAPLSLDALEAAMEQDGDDLGGQTAGQLSLDDLDELLEEDEAAEDAPAGAALTIQDLYDLAGLTFVLGFALLSFFKKSRPLKYAAMALSIGYLGFYKANLVSIVNIFSIISGKLPDFAISVPWYLMIGFTVASTVLWGRLYCGRICAFGALTQLMDAVLPARLRYDPPASFDRWAIYVKYAFLGLALTYFLASGDFLVYRYIEPFWMFTLNGNVVMWSMLAVLLLATVFVRNLYCRYLCSVGAALGLISNLTLFRIKRWGECNTCKICEKACEWGAIDGPTIAVSECVRCDDCERIYHDQDKCVHWIVLKRARPAKQTSSA
jgi:polyferredoxin